MNTVKMMFRMMVIGICCCRVFNVLAVEPDAGGRLVVSNAVSLYEAVAKIPALRKATHDVPIEICLLDGDYDVADYVTLRENKRGYHSSAVADVTFRAASGAHPRICGGRKISHWVEANLNGRSGVWVADLAHLKLKAPLALFYFDGRAMTLCRYPNEDKQNPFAGGWAYVDGKPFNMYKKVPGEREDIVMIKPCDYRAWTHPEEGRICIFPRYNWWNTIIPIHHYAASNHTLHLAKPIGKGFPARPGDRYCLMGLREELDAPGEWYHDLQNAKLYFIPPHGENPNALRTAVLADEGAVFEFTHVTNVVVRDLEICEAGSCVKAHASSRVRVINCRLHDVGFHHATAVSLEGTRNEVRDCDVWNTGSYGISITGGWNRKYTPETRDENVAENNYIHHTGRINRHGFGINVGGQGSRVANNLIHDMPRGGIFYSGRFLTIVSNRIRHVNLEMEDTAAIYGGGYLSNVGTKINNNWVSYSIGFSHDAKGIYQFRKTCAWGIYLDDCSGGAEVVGNVVDHCNGGGMHMHCARFNVVSNNVFVSNGGLSANPRQHSIRGWRVTKAGRGTEYLCGRAQKGYEALLAASPAWTNYLPLAHPPATPDAPNGLIMQGNRIVNNIWYFPDQTNAIVYGPGNYNVTNNLFDANVIWPGSTNVQVKLDGVKMPFATWRSLGQEVHSIVADPQFVDPARGDWSLRADSPAHRLGIASVSVQKVGLYLNENRRQLPFEVEGVREHPEWIKEFQTCNGR